MEKWMNGRVKVGGMQMRWNIPETLPKRYKGRPMK